MKRWVYSTRAVMAAAWLGAAAAAGGAPQPLGSNPRSIARKASGPRATVARPVAAPQVTSQEPLPSPPPLQPEQPATRLQEYQPFTLLKVGSPAPPFQLPTPDGGEVSLVELLRRKKAVLINFWFYR